MERTFVLHFHNTGFPASFSYTLSFLTSLLSVYTCFTTAALITLLNTITNLLVTNLYVVIVISFDFSKAFYTVRHFTLLKKMELLDVPDNAYNWLVDFFSGHSHCTLCRGQMSLLKSVTASIIQMIQQQIRAILHAWSQQAS